VPPFVPRNRWGISCYPVFMGSNEHAKNFLSYHSTGIRYVQFIIVPFTPNCLNSMISKRAKCRCPWLPFIRCYASVLYIHWLTRPNTSKWKNTHRVADIVGGVLLNNTFCHYCLSSMHSKSVEYRRTLCQHLCQENNVDLFCALFSLVAMSGHRNFNHIM
jgi:hypothetical protein